MTGFCNRELTLYNSVVTIYTNSLIFNNSTFSPHSYIYVCCVDLRTNSHYSPIQHKVTGFYNPSRKCLQRGTDWGFNCNSKWLQSLKSYHINVYIIQLFISNI